MNKTKDGQVVMMESTVSPVFDSDVGLSGFIAVQRDVTAERKGEEERKRLEEQLFQAQKLESIGTLAGGIAHDFNNVLGIILGYATILQHALADNEKATKGFDAINNAVQRGADLVRQILMFARKSEASFMPFDVNRFGRRRGCDAFQESPRRDSVGDFGSWSPQAGWGQGLR